jgi:hypothetical protein
MAQPENLVAIIEEQVAQSIGHWDGQLSEDRAREFDYYYGRPFGNEVEGESTVVSTDVADTIEGILPSILRIFTASDDAVRFDPNGPEDEEQAAQQTEVANYIFYRQNNGFLVLYEWFKDALLQKNGIVKYWWEDAKDNSKESYQGLTDGEYKMLLSGDGLAEITELEHTAYDDPQAVQQREQMIQQMTAQMQQPMPIPQLQQMQMQFEQFMQQPVGQLHDVTVRIIKDASKLCIKCIPPEEFGISAKHHCVSIQDTPFCYHRGRMTISELRAMGCPEDILTTLGSNDTQDMSPEALARDRYIDLQWPGVVPPADPSMKEVWVTECFIRLDEDGDGVAELRHIIMPGREVWIDEETDHINFAAITPIIMPHRWVGRSMSELVMDIQFTKSVIWRQMLNNLYLTNNPRKAVLSTAGGIVQANLDDLLTSRPGGIMREYVPGAIRNEEVPFVAGASFPMLEYMDSLKENRTGNTRYNQGTDADSLNKTARGISLIQSAGQQRLDLIARIFAETGVKDLMKGIVYMMSKYSIKPLTLKLRNKWVDVDPREWKTMLNMTINVGLGTGNRDVQLAHLTQMAMKQNELMATGKGYMVSDENIYNLYKKTSEAMGFKHPELFISDPEKVPPEAKQPPPNADVLKLQQEAQADQQRNQVTMQKEQMGNQTLLAIEQIKKATAESVAAIEAASKKDVEQMRIRAESEKLIYEANNSVDGAKKDVQTALKQRQLEEQAAIERMQTQIDAAIKDVTSMVSQYETKMLAEFSKAEAKSESKEKAKETKKNGRASMMESDDGEEENANMQKMHVELIASVSTLIDNLKAQRASL